MAYASLTDLETRQPVTGDSSYSDKVKLAMLDTASRRLATRLQRSFFMPISVSATGSLTFTDNPADGETVTVGTVTYRFKDAPAQANDVQRGASATLSAAALNQTILQGTVTYYYTGTTVNTDARSSRSALVLSLTARKSGPDGNDIPLSSTSSAITAVAFSGGLREFDELVQANVWMATIQMFLGKTASKVAGKGNATDDMKAELKDMIEQMEYAPALYDVTGAAYSCITGEPVTNADTYPYADTGPVELWDFDPDREFNRV